MSDPIERMNRLRDEVAGAPMPPAAAVRRRGDRLRRRRTVAVTTGVALAVVAIVLPIAALTTTDAARDLPVDPAESTTSEPTTSAPTSAVPTSTLAEAHLLRDEDTVFNDEVRWQSGGTAPAESDPGSACRERRLDVLGAVAVIERTWLVDSGIHLLVQAVAEFPTADEAEAAYDEVTGWYVECPTLASENGYDASVTPVQIPVDGEAQVIEATYDLDPEGTAEQGGEAYYDVEEHVGVVVTGNRLTVLRQDMPQAPAATYGWGETVPVERMLPVAADRLADSATPAAVRPAPTSRPASRSTAT